jgi:hypothetical protein
MIDWILIYVLILKSMIPVLIKFNSHAKKIVKNHTSIVTKKNKNEVEHF